MTRLAVYDDCSYRRSADGLHTDQAFVVFVCGLQPWVDTLTIVGRLEPAPGTWHYTVPDGVGFCALPHYAALSQPVAALRGMSGSLRRFWRLLADVDAVWLLGPHPLALAFAVMAAMRRRRVVIGVRQDMPAYTRHRHPRRPELHAAAWVLERAWRLLARFVGVVAIGPDLAHRYRAARRVLASSVSLIRERDLVCAENGSGDFDGELRVLSVGRLDAEKNPLLLADILAVLHASEPRWRLVVAGEGPMRGALEARLAELGLSEHAELHGYVPVDDGLLGLYHSSDLFLHVSWTEGFPQVLIEAFGSRLPVVATAVGGVADVVGDAALLVEPGDPLAPARELARLAADAALRARLVERGVAVARSRTLEAETRRVADLIAGRDAGAAPPRRARPRRPS